MTTELEARVRLDRLDRKPAEIAVDATAEACARIAARLGLASVEAVSVAATTRICPPGDIYRVQGIVSMAAERTCTVLLEPFVDVTETDFDELLTSNPKSATVVDDMTPLGEDETEIALVTDGEIDVGEIALQYLAMALDPFPVNPEAQAPTDPAADQAADAPVAVVGDGKRRPFADLGRLLAEKQRKR